MSFERIGQEALSFLDKLEKEYGDTASIGTILLAADVIIAGDGPEWINPIALWCSDPRCYVQRALIAEVQGEIERLYDQACDDLQDFDEENDESEED